MAIRIHTLPGLLTWFFTPVKLYGGDGGAESNDTSSTSAAEQGLADGVGDKSGYHTEDTSLNFIGTESLFGGTTSINTTPYGPLNEFESAQLDDYNNERGISSYNNTYNTNYSVESERTVLAFDFEVFGVNFNFEGFSIPSDTHYDSTGQELSFAGEFVADISELSGLDISNDTAQAIGSVLGVATAYGLGAGVAAMAVAAANATVDVAYATGAINALERSNAKAGIAVASVVTAAYNLTIALDAIYSVPTSVLSPAERAIMGAMSIGVAYSSVVGFNAAFVGPTSFSGFVGSTPGGRGFGEYTANKNYTSLQSMFDAYGQWQNETGAGYATDLSTIEKDPFEFMAGGNLYNIQSAGNELYIASKNRNPDTINKRELDLSKEDRTFLFQEGSLYASLEPIDTSTTIDEGDIYRAGQITQINRAIAVYSASVEAYNLKVASYNAKIAVYDSEFGGTTHSSRVTYDDAPGQSTAVIANTINTAKTSIEAFGVNVQTLATKVTDIRDRFNV